MPERLHHTIKPEQYDLFFSVDFDHFTFTGKQTIRLIVTESLSGIHLHCEELSIEQLSLHQNNRTLPVSFELADGELRISSKEKMSPGEYQLELSFKGVLNDDLAGFYRSRYIDNNGQEAFLATTQFEAPYARKAFPCFDEPDFKATFVVTLEIPGSMSGISNMPVESECLKGNKKIIHFIPTPPMSTYLLYLGAGNFDFIEQRIDGRDIRVYGVNGKSSQGKFALKIAADVLRFFEQYSGVAYPLPKLDLLAIPDFAAGAMENWGACTFREVLLYVDETSTSLTVKKRVAEVIAHELWHQWSGNLVTMKWWDDLWLNEAFATYQAFRAVDHFYPKWHIWDDFIIGDTKSAFDMDMLFSTHPIAVPVHTPNEIEEIFDHISYGKGGSVLRMIEGYIGEESFRKGVSAYVTEFSFKNTVASDLWNTLEQNSGQPVKEMLISWVNKPGFPILNATQQASTLHINQQRFSTNRSNRNEIWPIPLTWISSNGENEKLFQERECEIPLDGFMKINKHQSGFYRVLYDRPVYDKLCEAVSAKQLHEYDRWGILNDLWACVFAGLATLGDLLYVMDSYETEGHVFVLREIKDLCTKISHLLRLDKRGEELFYRYHAPFSIALNKLGWHSIDEEQPHHKQLRPIALSFLIRAGNDRVRLKALSMAESYLESSTIDPDVRDACLSAVSIGNSPEIYRLVKTTYENKNNIEEKLSLLETLSEFTDPELLNDYLNYAMSHNVRRQDLRIVFSRIAHNPTCPRIFFDWVKENWNTLRELRKSHFVYMGLLQTLITTALDENTLTNIGDFLTQNDTGFEKTKANAFEKAQLYIAFRERERLKS